MAVLSGNVIGNLSGRLGNLSVRTIDGRILLAARPSSFNVSYEQNVVAIREKFAVTATFSKYVFHYQLSKISERKSKLIVCRYSTQSSGQTTIYPVIIFQLQIT